MNKKCEICGKDKYPSKTELCLKCNELVVDLMEEIEKTVIKVLVKASKR